MNSSQTKARMLLLEGGLSDVEVERILPDVMQRYSGGAGTIENAVTLAFRAHEQKERLGLTRHGHGAKRRGY